MLQFTYVTAVVFTAQHLLNAQISNRNTAKENGTQTLRYFHDSRNCECDKDPFACDMNCCCDVECAFRDKDIFDFCSDDVKLQTSRKCSDIDPLVRSIHIPILELELAVSDVLCIEYDNSPMNEPISRHDILTARGQFPLYTSEKSMKDPEDLPKESYMRASPFYACRVQANDGSCLLDYFNIPQVDFNGACNSGKPASFLIDEEFTCWRRLDNDFMQKCDSGNLPSWLLDDTYSNVYLIVKDARYLRWFSLDFNDDNPTVMMSSSSNNGETSFLGMENTTVPVLTLCRDYRTKVRVKCSEQGLQTSRLVENKCVNVVAGVRWTVSYSYNGLEKDGIQEVRAEVFLRNISKPDLSGFSQFFSIVYRQHDELISSPFETSGQPGYIRGRPILAGKLQTKEIEERQGIQFIAKTSYRINMPESPNEWLTSLSSVDGYCDSSARSPVLFGVNTVAGCMVVPEGTCEMTQASIRTILMGSTLQHDRVGMFGNSNASRPGEWVPIRSNDSSTFQLSGDLRRGYCENLLTGVTLRISYVLTGSSEAPQPQIIDAIHEFDTPRQRSVYCRDTNCNSFYPIPVRFSVVFEDQSEPVIAEIAPTREIAHYLPADFFYPFFVNTANKPNGHKNLVVLLLSVMFCLLSPQTVILV